MITFKVIEDMAGSALGRGYLVIDRLLPRSCPVSMHFVLTKLWSFEHDLFQGFGIIWNHNILYYIILNNQCSVFQLQATMCGNTK